MGTETRRPTPTPYEMLRQKVTQLRDRVGESNLSNLLAWVPQPELQGRIVISDEPAKAKFTAATLGHYSNWSDAISSSRTDRLQLRGSVADVLGLTVETLTELVPLINDTTEAMEKYIDFFIDSSFGGSMTPVANALESAAAVHGFVSTALRRSHKQGKPEGTEIKVTFADGSEPPDDGLLYIIDEVSPDIPVETVSYDEDNGRLHIKILASP
jgi:hypothetical protein